MKILFIIESLGKGGAERVLVNTLPELQKLGIHCEVATLFEPNDLASELNTLGIKTHQLDLSSRWNMFEAIFKLSKLIKQNSFNIVHAHLFYAHFYAGLYAFFNRNLKTVVTFHNLAFNAYPTTTVTKKFRKYIEKLMVDRYTGVTAVSRAVKKHYEEHFSLKNIEIIHNSIPLNNLVKYKSIVIEKRDQFTVLTPGRLVKEKGHIFLIEAIKQLNKKNISIEFLIVGKGPLQDKFEHAISELENVQLLGEMQYDELMMLFNESHLVVVPSIHEAFGLVVAEAMFLEVPLVATSVGGIIDLVEYEKEGLLVPPANPEALVNAIERMYHDETLRKKLATNAFEKVKQFDTKYIALQWKNYYEELLHG